MEDVTIWTSLRGVHPQLVLDVNDDHICRARPGELCKGYKIGEDGANGFLSFDYAGCLECGTCRIVCPRAPSWERKRGGSGRGYRFANLG